LIVLICLNKFSHENTISQSVQSDFLSGQARPEKNGLLAALIWTKFFSYDCIVFLFICLWKKNKNVDMGGMAEWLTCSALEYWHYVRAFPPTAPCLCNFVVLFYMPQAMCSSIVYPFCSHTKVVRLCKKPLLMTLFSMLIVLCALCLCFALIAFFISFLYSALCPFRPYRG
jgi:quinol-cytochrome oxidoreductase complex cytochrome b subunit